MNIQELHGWPQPRERTSHMIGRSLGETLQGASNLYLQNKIQGYFDQQKELRQLGAEAQQRRQTAQAYENLTGIKGLAQKLEGMPIQFQEKALSEYGGGNQMLPWNQPIRPPSGTNPPINPPVNVPTAQKITGDIATAQRMGLTGEGEGQEEGLEGTSGLPLGVGMPTPRGQALQGQAPQYQEAPAPPTPSGAIPPKPMSGYPLADMSNEDFLQYLNTIPSQSRRKEVYQAREKEKAAQRAEGMLSLKERDTIAREKIAEQKLSELSKEDKEFVKKIDDSAMAIDKGYNALSTMRAIRSQKDVGAGTSFFAANRQARSEYNVAAKDLLAQIKEMFPRGFTDREFSRIEDKWMPVAGDSNATLDGKEKGFEGLINESERIYSTMQKYQREDGSYPKHIQSLVSKDIYNSKKFKKFKREMQNGPVTKSQIAEGTTSNKPFKANQVAPGYRMKTPDGRILVSDGSKWTEEKE